jgi:hypothetical protein
MISRENGSPQELLVGVKTTIPLKMINAAAPDGALQRLIKTVEIIIYRFLGAGCEPDRFMLVSPEQLFRSDMNPIGLYPILVCKKFIFSVLLFAGSLWSAM